VLTECEPSDQKSGSSPCRFHSPSIIPIIDETHPNAVIGRSIDGISMQLHQ
jgi:hypothetical protein